MIYLRSTFLLFPHVQAPLQTLFLIHITDILSLSCGRMSFDRNEQPATVEEAGVPQQAAIVVPQPHKPHSVATTYPSNLFQAGEGLQLHGTLNNNAFIHASSGSGFQPFERNKDSLNTEVPIRAEGDLTSIIAYMHL